MLAPQAEGSMSRLAPLLQGTASPRDEVTSGLPRRAPLGTREG